MTTRPITTEPNDKNISERLELIDQLKSFLVTAPDGQQTSIKQHLLITSGENISCIKWNDAFYISGTDIVRCLIFRFLAFGRPIQNIKKFEEGIFSDLRNLKPGTDAILEEPKSPFLDLLFKNNCIRTQKKQKVFFWYSVPHDRLFLDALERDLKREKMGFEPTSIAIAHPAITISLDTTQAMFDEFRKTMMCELNLLPFYQQHVVVGQQQVDSSANGSSVTSGSNSIRSNSVISDSCSPNMVSSLSSSSSPPRESNNNDVQKTCSTIFGQFSLFEGSPTYKQRRRRVVSSTQQQQQQQQQPRKPSAFTTPTPPLPSTTWSSSSSTSNNNDDIVRHFDCPLSTCGKFFKRLEHMKRHLRTHTMERPYLCDLCGKRFSRSDNLAQHKKTHERDRHSKSSGGGGGGRNGGGSHGNGYGNNTFSKRRDNSNSNNNNNNSSSNNDHYGSSSTTKRVNSSHASQQQQQCNNFLVVKETDEKDIKSEPQSQPQPQQQPELSNSTAPSSTTTSCDSSPIYSRFPIIKIEDACSYLQQMTHDSTGIIMAEQQQEEYWNQQQYWQEEQEEEYWNQQHYSSSSLMMHQFQQQQPNYYYYSTTTTSNSSSCLTSPTMINLTLNSPINRLSFADHHYYSSMNPADSLFLH